jgi:hypothetical protein
VTPQVRGRPHRSTKGQALRGVACWLGTALATPGLAFAEEPHLRSTADLDGTYLTVGPVAGALASQEQWDSAVGAELSLVQLREGCIPALLGFSFGGVVFDDRPGTRTWLEAELAIDRLPVKLGLSGGLAAELDRVRPPRFGTQATLWAFAGIVPYVRVGWLDETGSFFETGVMIKIPVKIRY